MIMAKRVEMRFHTDYNWSDDVAAGMLISHLRRKAAAQQFKFPKQIQIGGRHGSQTFYISCYRNDLYDFVQSNVDGVVIEHKVFSGVSTIRFEIVG
jgi:hypothetical protein